MKGAKEHRIPLSEAAIQILTSIEDKKGYVFQGQKKDMPLSNMAMEMVMRRLEIDATVRGFRSSFRDWAGDMTDASRK